MSLINLSVKHGLTREIAKQRLESAVRDAQGQFAGAIQQVAWNADKTAVTLTGPGVVVDLKVDAEHVHATGDIPILGKLLGGGFGSTLAQGLRGLLGRHFPTGIESSAQRKSS